MFKNIMFLTMKMVLHESIYLIEIHEKLMHFITGISHINELFSNIYIYNEGLQTYTNSNLLLDISSNHLAKRGSWTTSLT